EAGEVVQAGQVVIRLARDGGRDAVFDVSPRFLDQQPAAGLFRVSLATDPQISVMGRVREIAPQADPVTGTFRIRVGLDKLPAGMQLGSTIVGTLEKSSALVVSIPASALMVIGADPAVWVVDPATSRVALRRIEVIQFDYARVTVAQGLEAGEMVVSAGIQALHPGQQVKILPPASGARSASLSQKRQAAMACLGSACDKQHRLTANGIFNSARGIDG
ncbi:MAG: efflux RND transporter periplasmic adaptor subunit, partial [Methylobacterium sp.]|nr:efflux RND transporter periplasmic adaptor subunit [Methylobacterium sp.]